jgi:antagonist of KipI
MSVIVARAGFFTTVQDLGRTGFRQHGVSLGGALDAHALRVANLLVGNDESAAGIETTMGPVRLRFEAERLIAWSGGAVNVHNGSIGVPAGRAAIVRPGEEVSLVAGEHAARAWLAISGGVDAPIVLGSRSTDLRARFGGLEGRALRDGDRVPLGEQSQSALRFSRKLADRPVATAGASEEWAQTGRRRAFLRLVRGADWDQFDARAQTALLSAQFTVGDEADRMGVRLNGATLSRHDTCELISEPVAPGTIQVPPNGQPILLLGDCQTIGGYPKIAHVITVDMPIAAQLRPGNPVHFGEVSLGEARALLAAREHDLRWFRAGLKR